MHQRHIVGLHCFLKLLHFIELSLYSCFHLQAGIVQLQIGTQGLCLGNLQFLPVREYRETSSDQETVAFLTYRRIATVTHFQLRQPVLLVHAYLFRSRTGSRICRLKVCILHHYFVVQCMIVTNSFHCRITVFCKLQRKVTVHRQQLLKCHTMCRMVLCHFRLHLHAFHLDFIHLQGIGISFFQTLFKQLQQGIGIFLPFHEQSLFLIQANQVETQILGLQQNIAAKRLLLTVEHIFLQFSGTVACRIQGREIKSLCHHQFRTGHSIYSFGKERAVLHTGVFQVILRLHFHLGCFRRMKDRLQFLVILLYRLQYFFYFLCLHAAGKCQSCKPHPSYFFHSSVLLRFFFRFINSYTIGMTNAFRKVEVNRPPRMTFAIGL